MCRLLKLLLFFLPLLLSCNKTESDVHREFPIAQNQIDEFIVQENTYWNSASVVYQDENQQIIQLTRDQRVSCNINLNTLDKKYVSCMGIGFWFKSEEMTEEEILQYKQAQKKISEMIRLFYTSDKKSKVFSAWERFCIYWEQPVECEGNRIQWNGGPPEEQLQINLSRSDYEDLWLLERVRICTAEFKEKYMEEMSEVVSNYPNYKEYSSILEMKQDLYNQCEERYGSINGKINVLKYDTELPYPGFLNEYPDFLSSEQGYACGKLTDHSGEIEVWCSPQMNASEQDREFQFHYLPGEIPVVYIVH